MQTRTDEEVRVAKTEAKAPKQFDPEAELARLEDEDGKLAKQADELGKDFVKIKDQLRDINAERRALAERVEAVKRARSMGIEHLRALHQMIEDVGGIESLAEVGTPGTES